MNLLAQAEADNSFILEDAVNGFGRAMTLTSPDGSISIPLVGQVQRIGVKLDQATGFSVAGETGSITFRESTFKTLHPSHPEMTQNLLTGWIVDTTDSAGTAIKYRVTPQDTMPDMTAGRVTITGLKRIPS